MLSVQEDQEQQKLEGIIEQHQAAPDDDDVSSATFLASNGFSQGSGVPVKNVNKLIEQAKTNMNTNDQKMTQANTEFGLNLMRLGDGSEETIDEEMAAFKNSMKFQFQNVRGNFRKVVNRLRFDEYDKI